MNEDYIDYLACLTHHLIEPIRSQILPSDKKLGSPFYQLPKLKALTCALKQHVSNALGGDLQSESFHNLYTLYLYYSLSLSSGYRPIAGMFGKLEDINLRSGRYRINDKNALPGNSDRTVFLPL